jgi:hypothetical protein
MATVVGGPVEIHELSVEEEAAMFDAQARRLLGMSGAEFIAAYHAGRFDDDLDSPAVMTLAMLLPLGR